MIKNTWPGPKFTYAFFIALVIHVVILTFVKKETYDFHSLSDGANVLKKPLRIDQLKIVKPSEVEKLKKVGIKEGKKDANHPDLKSLQNSVAKIPKIAEPIPPKTLSLGNLTPQFSDLTKNVPQAPSNTSPEKTSSQDFLAKSFLKDTHLKKDSSFYFNYKDQKTIPRSPEQESLKMEATKNISSNRANRVTEKISNFEIRYERPEGVSEDELNSDEKAYYSFYVRSYQNYFSKIYSNYEKIVVERPGLAKAFDHSQMLIGKIDYDDKGNIITVKILKSSESDDLHYFFEETLKELNQPNPPKIFTKNRKQFSIYYQLQIN